MLDCHCHVDLYPDPPAVADRAEAAGAFTILVTNLPSAYEKLQPHIHGRRRMRLALGLHPLLAEQHIHEREKFRSLARETSFIGEVGLDFSRDGRPTTEIQLESFVFLLRTLAQQPKFITVHSRRAEKEVLRLLKQEARSPVVFHWYTGPLTTLKDAISDGHYFSINPAMLLGQNGQRIIAGIPRDRILTETDGPFVKIGTRAAEPKDIRLVEDGLARMWGISPVEVRYVVAENFQRIMAPVRRHVQRDSTGG
ncbi:MAG: Qat anti-phage system TatD family nuclease QatD [Terriglobales bacterium]